MQRSDGDGSDLATVKLDRVLTPSRKGRSYAPVAVKGLDQGTTFPVVFHVEYVDKKSQGRSKLSAICGDGSIAGISALVKLSGLDAWRLACP